jgi:hypothetical protein
VLGLLIVAQGRGTQNPGSSGLGIGLIIAVLILVAIGAYLLLKFFARSARASKGGVQPPIGETEGQPHPGSPPLESIERRS